MPPRKQVYGKRPRKAPTFASSALFTWSSSPDRPPTQPESIADTDESDIESDVKKVAERLHGVKIDASDKRQDGVQRAKREPLRRVDGNLGAADEKPEKTQPQKEKESCVEVVTKEVALDTSASATRKEEEPKIALRNTTRKTRTRNGQKGEDTTTVHTEKKTTRSGQRQTLCGGDEKAATDDAPNLYAKHTRPLLSLCADKSSKDSPTSFSEWTMSLEKYFNITKIAEASYGEVYRLSLNAPRAGFSKADESVLKIIALKPPPKAPKGSKNKSKAQESQMSSVANVTSEVQLLQRMTLTPGFTNFREIKVLQGRPCGAFVKAWKDFNRAQKKGEKSYFPDPSRKTSYDENQLWAVIEMQDAGVDLEHFQVDNIWACWDVFWGVALSVAKGEEEAHFEHRDLHLGNICCRRAHQFHPTLVPEDRNEVNDNSEQGNDGPIPVISNVNRSLGFTGLETTIIDYTLSRADMNQVDHLTRIDAGDQDPNVAFLDLESEEGLFEGDANIDYQYEIYRLMRSIAQLPSDTHQNPVTGNTLQQFGSATEPHLDWRAFHPRTNLLWLHFVLRTLLPLTTARHGTASRNTSTVEGSHKDGEKHAHPSEVDQPHWLRYLEPSEHKDVALERAQELEAALLVVADILDPDQLMTKDSLQNTRDLIAVAVAEGWLSEADVLDLTEDGDLNNG